MCLVREESRLPFELFPAVSVRELQRKKQNIREILECSQPHPHADCIEKAYKYRMELQALSHTRTRIASGRDDDEEKPWLALSHTRTRIASAA